jgi:hypothetical protein
MIFERQNPEKGGMFLFFVAEFIISSKSVAFIIQIYCCYLMFVTFLPQFNPVSGSQTEPAA